MPNNLNMYLSALPTYKHPKMEELYSKLAVAEEQIRTGKVVPTEAAMK